MSPRDWIRSVLMMQGSWPAEVCELVTRDIEKALDVAGYEIVQKAPPEQ